MSDPEPIAVADLDEDLHGEAARRAAYVGHFGEPVIDMVEVERLLMERRDAATRE